MSGAERGKYLFRIARGIAERSRELAVVETLDNGKPIKETRDFDVPDRGAALLLPRRLGRQAAAPGVRADPAAARRGRPGDPVELPAADGGLEDRAGPGRRQHRGDQARRDHPAVDPGAGRDHRRRRPARRAWSTSSPAPATSARRWSPTPASTRSPSPGRPRSAGGSSASWPAPAARSPWSSAARAPTSSSTTPPIDQAVEGIVNGIFFNQGQVCCAGSRLLVQESIAEEFVERLRARVETLRVGDPMDKNTDVGAINSARPARRGSPP